MAIRIPSLRTLSVSLAGTAALASVAVIGASGMASAAAPTDAQSVAASIVPADQLASFDAIISHESGWNVNATNASSGAYGLGQALPASKMASAGADWQTNPATQIKWALSYMNSTYGSPNAAWSFWQAHNWY
ncbi:transglycosylase SLT domain-containing protein [Streptacidiphilus fuscans]|uniref:Transglycosylase SLT domain-containing protein n=1 Tax=Streptacidiphilus fuscans TaxID=2789292 RepID=A0A931FEJ7_9ACTN|nr:transglycosylase SLT domain-containing protein [Streptacidiphilus fuscans]MBF9068721.1 transglycosylase SLT domain-containing protein [Streptacidiphilus fuscans]